MAYNFPRLVLQIFLQHLFHRHFPQSLPLNMKGVQAADACTIKLTRELPDFGGVKAPGLFAVPGNDMVRFGTSSLS